MLRFLRDSEYTHHFPPQKQGPSIRRIAWVVVGLSVFGYTATSLGSSENPVAPLLKLASLGLGLTSLVVLALLRRGFVVAATALLAGALFICNILSILPYGIGGSSVTIIGFVLPVVLLGYVWGRAGFLLSLSLVLLSLLLLIMLESWGMGAWRARTIIPVNDAIMSLILIGLIAFGTISSQRDIVALLHAREQANAELRAANLRLSATQQQLEETLGQLETLTLTNERQRMAREIHDGMGPHLHTAITIASALAEEPEHNQTAQRMLRHVVDDLAKAQIEMRRALTALKGDNSDLTLEEMLAGPLQDAQHYRVQMTLELLGTPRPLSAVARHSLYRVAQEAITNLGRHAQASQGRLTLDYRDPDWLVLTIADNGHGLHQSNPQGHGLDNMRTRVEALGGQFAIHPSPQGVTVWLKIPT